LWERAAKVATPHEGHHRQYCSFTSNSPATDGRYLYTSFGSRGIYCYDLNEKLISTALHGDKSYTLTNNGILSRFNAATSEPYYLQQRPPPLGYVAAKTVIAHEIQFLWRQQFFIIHSHGFG
jgi:hypothetical protein